MRLAVRLLVALLEQQTQVMAVLAVLSTLAVEIPLARIVLTSRDLQATSAAQHLPNRNRTSLVTTC